ncbi:hypothetical protein ES703_117288 [subsurface metagenome]
MISPMSILPIGIFKINDTLTMKRFTVFIILASYVLVPGIVLSFGGIFQIDYYGLIDPVTFFDSERIRITIAPEIAGRNSSDWIDYLLNAVLYLQPIGEPAVIDPERIIREAYLGFHFRTFNVYLGQRFINWGKVDVMSPLNVINHSDTEVLSMDNIFEASVPDFLGQLKIYPSDSINIDIVYVPFFQPNIYPIEEIKIDEEITFDLPWAKTQYYNVHAAFKKREIGLFTEWGQSVHFAVNYTSFLFDFIAAYSFYMDHRLDFDLSGIEEEIIEDVDFDTHVITGTAFPSYNRVHSFGFGVSFYLKNLLISADASLKLSRDRDGSCMEIKNSELFYSVQVERMFFTDVRGQLNFFHLYVLNYDAQIQSPYSFFVEAYINAVIDNYLFQKPQSQIYFLGHLDTTFIHQKLSVGINVIYEHSEIASQRAYYAAPRVGYKLSDYLTLFAGADIWLKGSEERFIGRNKEKDNFYVRLQLAL